MCSSDLGSSRSLWMRAKPRNDASERRSLSPRFRRRFRRCTQVRAALHSLATPILTAGTPFLGDITGGRLQQSQGAGSSGGEGSRGSSYGHEIPPQPQGIQQPVPRPAAAVHPPQAGGKYRRNIARTLRTLISDRHRRERPRGSVSGAYDATASAKFSLPSVSRRTSR